MKTPQKVDLLLGCDVVTIDGKNRVIRDGAVAIKGNKIAWIGKASVAKRNVAAKSVIDGSGQIAMPGLIDAHVHTAQTLLRGKIAEIDGRRPVGIPVWWNYYVPFESMLTDDDVYLSGLLCYANMISVGTTCFAEAGGPHPDAIGRAAIDTGIRGFVSLNTIDQGEHWPKTMITTTKKALDGNVGLVKRWKGTKGGTDRVQAWLSLRQIMTCTPALIEAKGDAARALDVKIHTHLCEGVYEIDYSLAKFGKRPAKISAKPWRARPPHALRPFGPALGKRDGPLRQAQAVGLSLRLQQLSHRPAPAAADVATRYRRGARH